MSGIVRNALRVVAAKNLVASTSTSRIIAPQFSRCLWHMSNRSQCDNSQKSTSKLLQLSETCSCGCGRSQHTKAEKELVEFLAEEIVAEKKAQKLKTIPTQVDGFTVSLDGAVVTMVKRDGNETITIAFNVNHTVDTDTEPELDPNDDKPDLGEMKSKPTFTVDIQRGKQTLGFTCSFNPVPGASGADETYNDIFGIEDITLFEGEQSENNYSVGGAVVDGYLYDLLMNYLEEKGISNEFAEKLIDLATNYEHSAYISLLEGLSKFTTTK